MTEALNETATVRELFFSGVPGGPRDALAESLRESGTLAPLVPGVPGLTAVVNREVAAATDGLLSLNLADVAAAGWKRFDALRQAAHRTREAPETEEIVTVASHKIECNQRPTVELFIDGKSIASIQIELQIAMSIAGGLAVVRQARLMEFRSASCTVSGSLAVQQAVIKKRQHQFDLPGAIRLRNGVPLLASDASGVTVDQLAECDSGSQTTTGAWYSDPTRRYELRWWDGSRWTQRVANNGSEMSDPVCCGTVLQPLRTTA